VILATAAQYSDIEKLLPHIDARPLQVFLDMAIAEITLSEGETIGIQHRLLNQGQVSIGGETNSVESISETAFNELNEVGGNTTPMEGFTYILSAPGRLSAMLRALVREDKATILSDPHIFVRNNTEAKINIGDRIPIRNVIIDDGVTTENIEYEETGIIMTVTPQISPENSILLNVSQEVSEVGSESYGDTGAASFRTRNTETSLVIEDKSTILIGGLIERQRIHHEEGIPLLKDLPLVGRLFRVRETTVRRQELVVLITAQIMRGPEDEKTMTGEALKEASKWLQPEKVEESDSEKVKRLLRKILKKKK
jgi:general secretion pathway protein D